MPNLEYVNIRNNTNLSAIYGIDKLSKLSYLTCYGNISLESVEKLDKAIVQNKDNLKSMNLDVLLFPKAIGYHTVYGTYNQEAMNAIEHINGGVTGSKTVGFAGDKVDDKVHWSEPLNLLEDVTIGMHSMLKLHNTACKILHDNCRDNCSAIDTIAAVERYLAENVTYDDDSLEHDNTKTALTSTGPNGVRVQVSHKHGVNGAYDCLVNKSCVCQGYTRGEQYLLALKGIRTREVSCIACEDKTGFCDSDNQNDRYHRFSIPDAGYHSIVQIKFMGSSYYSDPCWNAGLYQQGNKSMPFTLLTKDEIRKTHTLSAREAGYITAAWEVKRSEVDESLRCNDLFRNTRLSEVNRQRDVLLRDVKGIVRGADGRIY